MQNPYFVIIAGAGLSGLITAFFIHKDNPEHLPILIIDNNLNMLPRHTISYWHRYPTPFDHLAVNQWQTLQTNIEHHQKNHRLKQFRFSVLHSDHIHSYLKNYLKQSKNIIFSADTVLNSTENQDSVSVQTAKTCYQSDYFLDSRPPSLKEAKLSLQGFGYEIKVSQDLFSQMPPVFIDTRGTDSSKVEFFYTIPLQSNLLLVDFTSFSAQFLTEISVSDKIHAYIKDHLNIASYHVVRVEGNIIPTPLALIHRKSTRRMIDIGKRGGCLKLTTGFAFTRIIKDAVLITQAVNHHCFFSRMYKDPAIFRFIDQISLTALSINPGLSIKKLNKLSNNHDFDIILKFLDQETNFFETLKILFSTVT